eukprot:CAMPEP_0196721578 /NCGR_PEP_ID=MMETSP1091-20130531/4091_1 /TAXON_ID=302021 /ORGANISM="Rhodomonas sp., Strain CCMP768" /LENGTH=433 /DNA_ID=CAMNT_0042063077 /DNA_START=82 /DNA_END=1383 /DNA_ORIENTATION=-
MLCRRQVCLNLVLALSIAAFDGGMGFMMPGSGLGRVALARRSMARLGTVNARQHVVRSVVPRSMSPRMCAASSVADKDTTKDEAKPAVKKRVLSGVQPTGNLHLGNYMGAIRQWVQNQEEYENFFFVVDLHAITAPHDPKELQKTSFEIAALYLACGIDPKLSKIFIQSHVPAHSELTWLLNCVTPMGWMEKMIQYKEKAKKQGESVSIGLFDYPILMAADILLYQTQLVPVGEDQRQHLELSRDIARRFNDLYCKKKSMPAKGRRVFREPEALITKEGARIMSLQDGRSKMSKSDPTELSRLNLLDPPDVIAKKIKKCKTDAFTGMEWDNPERPECTNLLNIYQAVTGRSREDILGEVGEMKWGEFKPLLADAVVQHIAPIQKRYYELIEDRSYLNSVLSEGAHAADEVASATLDWAKTAMGITSRKDLTLP